MNNSTFNETLSQFDAGLFEKKVARAMQDVVLGVVNNSQKGQKGKIVIEITIAKDASSERVEIQHKLAYQKPTLRGKSSEEDTTSTPMYPARNGAVSIAPENQDELFKQADVARLQQ